MCCAGQGVGSGGRQGRGGALERFPSGGGGRVDPGGYRGLVGVLLVPGAAPAAHPLHERLGALQSGAEAENEGGSHFPEPRGLLASHHCHVRGAERGVVIGQEVARHGTARG